MGVSPSATANGMQTVHNIRSLKHRLIILQISEMSGAQREATLTLLDLCMIA